MVRSHSSCRRAKAGGGARPCVFFRPRHQTRPNWVPLDITHCLAGSALVAGIVFYGVVANCHLSQNVTVIEEKASPNGLLLALHLKTDCEALVGYCPSFSQVRIAHPGQDPKKEGVWAFELSEEDNRLYFDWISNNALRIMYSEYDKVKYRRQRLDSANLDIQYQPIGNF